MKFTPVSFAELRLEWDEPFTWMAHNITEYRITEMTESGMNSTTTTNQTMYSYWSPNGKPQQTCQNITFAVSAYSDIGFSEPFVAAHGLPIGN